MGALASCYFPFLNKWKNFVDRNRLAAFIDAILCGWSQIILSDNSVSGLLLITASFIASTKVGAGALWASFIAVCFLNFIKVPRIILRLGIYVFAPTLTGAILAEFLFPEGLTVMFFVFIGLAAIFATILTAGLGVFFEKWEAPCLSLPFAVTVFVFILAAQNFGFIPETELISPAPVKAVAAYGLEFWTSNNIISALISGVSQVVAALNPITTVLVLVAIIISSRIDFLSALLGVTIATCTAIYFGAPKIPILIGLYGFNGIFLMLALTGRMFTISVVSVVFNMIIVVFSTIVASCLAIMFAPYGCSFTAMPFALLGILAAIASHKFQGIEYNKPLYWGVPETVQATKEWFKKNPNVPA